MRNDESITSGVWYKKDGKYHLYTEKFEKVIELDE